MQCKPHIYNKHTYTFIYCACPEVRLLVLLKPVTVVSCHHVYIRRTSAPVKASAALAD